MLMNKNVLISVACLIALVVLFMFIYDPLGFKKTAQAPTPIPAGDSNSLGEEISGQVDNPAESLPQNNVFEQAKVNPYKDVYKNPFQ